MVMLVPLEISAKAEFVLLELRQFALHPTNVTQQRLVIPQLVFVVPLRRNLRELLAMMATFVLPTMSVPTEYVPEIRFLARRLIAATTPELVTSLPEFAQILLKTRVPPVIRVTPASLALPVRVVCVPEPPSPAQLLTSAKTRVPVIPLPVAF